MTSLEDLYRREYGRILATLIRVTRDFSLAEDALQDAFTAALTRWPVHGEPPNPVAWLMATARNKAVDLLRQRTLARDKVDDLAALAAAKEHTPVPLDMLRLLFTCCHPALSAEAQVALTLRTICGLSTEEIARAFLVPVPTLAQRLVRAQTKIRLAGIPYEVPPDQQLADRLPPVLAAIYLVFNEGYSASSGSRICRTDLCRTAIDLARDMVPLLPEQGEVQGLLALMLFSHSRRHARTDSSGDLILLDDQDRSLWDRAMIAEGAGLMNKVLQTARPGPYTLQAAIASCHSLAPSAGETDWRRIAELYSHLARVQPSPVVELNRAIAVGMAEGAEAGLALLERIDLAGYHLLHAARAEMLRRLNRFPEAASAYREALARATNSAERRLLEKRLAEVSAAVPRS